MCQLGNKRAQSNTCSVLEFIVALGFLLAVVSNYKNWIISYLWYISSYSWVVSYSLFGRKVDPSTKPKHQYLMAQKWGSTILSCEIKIKVLHTISGVIMQLGSDSLLFVLVESVVRKLTEEVQEQQRLAEAVGGLYQLQPVLLQVSSGEQHFPVHSSGSGKMCCWPSHRVYPPPALNSSHLCVESLMSVSIQS